MRAKGSRVKGRLAAEGEEIAREGQMSLLGPDR
jgi:hypothetical protein